MTNEISTPYCWAPTGYHPSSKGATKQTAFRVSFPGGLAAAWRAALLWHALQCSVCLVCFSRPAVSGTPQWRGSCRISVFLSVHVNATTASVLCAVTDHRSPALEELCRPLVPTFCRKRKANRAVAQLTTHAVSPHTSPHHILVPVSCCCCLSPSRAGRPCRVL